MYSISLKSVVFSLATYNFVVTGVEIVLAHRITFDDMLGPISEIFCGLSFPCTTCIYWWTVSNKTVAGNGALIEAEASRFNILVEIIARIGSKNFYGDSLQIRNALKTDIGVYECHITINEQRVGHAILN